LKSLYEASKVSGHVHMCYRGIEFTTSHTVLLFDFGTFLTVCYFLFFIFTTIYPSNIWLFNFQYSFFLLLLSPGFVIRVTQPVPLMEQELHTLPEHLRSPPVSGGSCCSIFGCLCRDLYFCPFWFVHCVVCTFFDLRYLQTLLTFIVLPRTN
jgi:hypothetical protein